MEQQLEARRRDLEDLRSGATERALVEKIADLEARLERKRFRERETEPTSAREQADTEILLWHSLGEGVRQELAGFLAQAQRESDPKAYGRYKNLHRWLSKQIGAEHMIRLGMKRVELSELEPGES